MTRYVVLLRGINVGGKNPVPMARLREVLGELGYEDVVTYPANRQDIAVAVGEDVEAGALVAAARETGGTELREVRVFDVYRGDQVGEGRKSVALHLVFQAPDRTLTDEEAEVARTRIVEALRERFDAELRA